MNSHGKPVPSRPGLFSFLTLGCKSNQYDSAAMAAGLERAGLEAGTIDVADIIVINTCMVTGATEAQCRKEIRRARRANKRAKLVVAGCMSAGSKEQIMAMEEVDLVIEPSQKGFLAGILGLDSPGAWRDWPEDPAVDLSSRDRGFLKIQDGCNAACTYCVVPLVRGRSRSLAPREVSAAVRSLMDRGVSEVVLTGIHLGHYGSDLQPVVELEDLLEMLLADNLPGRLRLSSIEPLEITTRLVEILAGADGGLSRHIHIPLQSGSDGILRAMGRPYVRDHFRDAVRLLMERVPGIGIGCDVICGFPGESGEDFNRTRELIEEFKIPFVHAFPYSPRPGTKAAMFKDEVPHQVKKERVARMIRLAGANRQLFARSFVGDVVKTVLEARSDRLGRRLGLTDNYLQVAVNGQDLTPVKSGIHDISVKGTDGDVLVGSMRGSTIEG